MRIKIQIKPLDNSIAKENLVFAIPAKIVTFYDFHQFLLEKINVLKAKTLRFKLQDQFTINLSEKIKDIILNEDSDILTIEVWESKKRTIENQGFFSDFSDRETSKKIKICEFCEFIEKCSKIKDILNNQNPFSEVQLDHSIGHFEEKDSFPIEKILLKEKKIEKIPINEKKNEKILINEKKIEKNPLKEKNIEKNDNSLKKPLNKEIFKKPMENSDTSSEESSSEEFVQKNPKISSQKPLLIQKKANENSLNLNIPTPEEEFQRKKSQWNSIQNQVKIPFPQSKANNIKAPMKNQGNPLPNQEKPYFIPISQEFLTKYQETHENKSFFQLEDYVKFKVFELCPDTFSPILSQFRIGTIKKINEENPNILNILLKSGENLELERKEMLDLNIGSSNLDEERQKLLGEIKENEKKTKENEKITKENEKIVKENEKIVKKNNNKEYSKEEFIARQVNYYFSEKNYMKDEFIQAHVKKNEEKYFPIRLLLNFPKIKNVTQDFDWLKGLLKEYQKNNKETCNFEFGGVEEEFIRKRNIA